MNLQAVTKMYGKLTTGVLRRRLASLEKDLAENRTQNMLFDHATAEKQAGAI
jgi:hypothetical protein